MTERLLAERVAGSGVKFGTSGARGLVEAMSDEVCYAYAAAFVRTVAGDRPTVLVGHDLRPSSPRIAAACAAAVRDAGRAVAFAGALPTPALAFHGARTGAPAIVVTGSHIPFDRNGIKFYRADGEITKADEAAMLACRVAVPEAVRPAELGPADPAARDGYVARYVDFFGAQALRDLRVAVYQHSSVSRDLIVEVLERLGARAVPLGRTDGFVPIDTEAVRPEDVERAREWASRHAFDAIVSTDGDGDRPLVGDEAGEWLRGDAVGVLCARWLGAATVVTPVSSNTAVERCGAFERVIRTRIGSPYVIEGMADAIGGTVVGYEANGGVLLGTPLRRDGRRLEALPTRDALLPILALLSAARERGLPLSALERTLPRRFTASDRLEDFATERGRALVERLAGDPQAAARQLAPEAGAIVSVDTTDGFRATFESGDIVHLRPSGNAPELRCYAEAAHPARARRLCAACLSAISAAGAAEPVAAGAGCEAAA